MVEPSNQLKGNILPGFNDLQEWFNCTVQTRPLLPLVLGPTEKVILSVHNEEEYELLNVHLEHLGYFIQKPDYSHITLNQLMHLADHVIGTEKSCSLEEITVDENAEWTLGEIYTKLENLIPLFPMKITHSKTGDRIKFMTKVAVDLIWMAHNIFMALKHKYLEIYEAKFPGVFHDLYIYVLSLSVEVGYPSVLASKLFNPLFINQIDQGTQITTFGDEEQEILAYYYNVLPFKGFGFKSTAEGIVPWNGLDDGEQREKFSIPLESEEKLKNLFKIEDAIRESINSIASNHEFGTPLWVKARKELFDVYMCFEGPQYKNQNSYMKTIKGFFTTFLGMAILQNQLLLVTPSWGIFSAPKPSSEQEDAKLKFLKDILKQRILKNVEFYKMIPNNAFNMVDVVVDSKEGTNPKGDFGSLPAFDTKVGGVNMMKLMIKFKFIPGTTGFQRGFQKMGLNFLKGSLKHEKTDQIMIPGLWSPYNSTEFSEWGNLNSIDPAKNQGQTPIKVPLNTINSDTFKKWHYEIKSIPINDPMNLLGLFYNMRLAILTTIGSAIVMNYPSFNPENKTSLQNPQNRQFMAILENFPKEVVRGFLAREKAPCGTLGNTLDLSPPPLTTKAYAITQSKTARESCIKNLKRLEWLGDSKDDTGLTERFKYLKSRFNVKKLLCNLENDMSFFYKRVYFTKPPGLMIRTENIIKNKSSYVYAPLGFMGSISVVQTPGGMWCVTGLEPTDSWFKMNVYGVYIDQNTCLYNPEQLAVWNTFETKSGFKEIATDEIIKLLLNETNDKVTTSQINQYDISKTNFLLIIEQLSAKDQYYQDCEPIFGRDQDVEDDEVEDVDDGPTSSAHKRETTSALDNLSANLAKRQKLMNN